jgi:hypothetical protein
MFGVISFPANTSKDLLNNNTNFLPAFGDFVKKDTFNIIGLNPVSNIGKSFSVNSDEWHPIWNFANISISGEIFIDKKKMSLGYFSENEFGIPMVFSPLEAQIIAAQMQLLLENEDPLNQFLFSMNAIGSGKADGQNCFFCKASGWMCIDEDQYMQCPFCVGFTQFSKYSNMKITKAKLQEFIEFLYHCGGFQIEGCVQYLSGTCANYMQSRIIERAMINPIIGN